MSGGSKLRKLLGSIIVIICIEIALFILIGAKIGVLNTLLLVVLTTVSGIVIAKKQGLQSVQKMRNSLSKGVPPGVPLIETFLIVIGGILLVSPGFFSDLIGFMLVIPFTRKLFKPIVFFWLRKKLKNGQVTIIQR